MPKGTLVRKITFVLFILVPLQACLPWQAMAQNVIFNPGFDMTPWDTGWTIDTSYYSSKYNFQYTKGDTYAEGDISKYLTPPRSCRLFAWDVRGGGGQGDGVITSISQIFHPVTACTVKLYSQVYIDGKDGAMGANFLGNDSSYYISYDSSWNTWEEWSHVFSPTDTIRGITIGIGGSGYMAGATVHITAWIDDVYVSGIETGTEENDFGTHKKKLIVSPNPFLCYTEIKTLNIESKIQVYDVGGTLVGEISNNVIGKNLEPGIYFIKTKGYETVKIVKLGRPK